MAKSNGNVKPEGCGDFINKVLNAKLEHFRHTEFALLEFEISNVGMTPIEAYFHICFDGLKEAIFEVDPPVSILQKEIPPYRVDFFNQARRQGSDRRM